MKLLNFCSLNRPCWTFANIFVQKDTALEFSWNCWCLQLPYRNTFTFMIRTLGLKFLASFCACSFDVLQYLVTENMILLHFGSCAGDFLWFLIIKIRNCPIFGACIHPAGTLLTCLLGQGSGYLWVFSDCNDSIGATGALKCIVECVSAPHRPGLAAATLSAHLYPPEFSGDSLSLSESGNNPEQQLCHPLCTSGCVPVMLWKQQRVWLCKKVVDFSESESCSRLWFLLINQETLGLVMAPWLAAACGSFACALGWTDVLAARWHWPIFSRFTEVNIALSAGEAGSF